MTDKTTARVLLVDDEVNFAKTLSARLKMRDLRVNTSTTKEDFLSKVERQEYDAIVMDISSPNSTNSLETTKRLKKIDPTIPIIALTPYGSIEISAKALKLGFSDFIQKPVQVGKLVQKIAAAKLHRRAIGKRTSANPALPQVMPSFG